MKVQAKKGHDSVNIATKTPQQGLVNKRVANVLQFIDNLKPQNL